MEKKQEQARAEEVCVRLARHLKDVGFYRTKKTNFTRVQRYWVEFGHLHKFTFGPYFRVHFGIRIINDTYENIILNGPDSDRTQGILNDFPFSLFLGQRRYNFEYEDSPESIEKCAKSMFKFWRKIGLPWFRKWQDPEKLIRAKKSPLSTREKEILQTVINCPSQLTPSDITKKELGIS